MSDLSLKARLKSVSLIFACGTALFSDGYANGIIGSVNTLLKRIYGTDVVSAHNYSTVLSSLAFAGTVVGMLIFGYLSDKMGRKFGMVISLLSLKTASADQVNFHKMLATGIVALFSALSAASSGAHGSVHGLLAMLSAMRFLLGIGVGAEYPCGSVAASEQTEQPGISKRAQHRWFALATRLIFRLKDFMIDFAFVIAAFVPLVLYWIFGEHHLRAVWRLSLGLGVVPALLVFLWRLNMEEPSRYRKDSMQRVDIPYGLVFRRYGVRLVAISLTWFIYDFITLSRLINIHSQIPPRLSITGNSDSLSVVFGWNVVINLFYMPGTFIGAFVVDYLGPKYTMITGLLLQAIIGFFMSGFYGPLTKHIGGFAVIYGIFLSFGEFGPGNNLGLLASKSSPTAVRGQFYGIAAAVGKIGAFIGTWAFPPMINDFGGSSTARGNTGPFWVGSASLRANPCTAGLAILSALITFFFVHPLTTDGMEKEDREFREYLEANGFDTRLMGLGEEETIVSEEPAIDEKISSLEKA
ncbi:hypothetical protein H0H92_007117 [Tricholoma furcatifolium]|nr:hypothetical protein H0H92_007117 [Tricholoma furcatifolium]